MLGNNFIQPPQSCAIPVELVQKEDGKLRLCVSYRRWSSVTIGVQTSQSRTNRSRKDNLPNPINSLLVSGYPFWTDSRICNSSGVNESQNRRLDSSYCIGFIGVALSHGETKEKHLEYWELVFERFKKAELELKLTICKLFSQ